MVRELVSNYFEFVHASAILVLTKLTKSSGFPHPHDPTIGMSSDEAKECDSRILYEHAGRACTRISLLAEEVYAASETEIVLITNQPEFYGKSIPDLDVSFRYNDLVTSGPLHQGKFAKGVEAIRGSRVAAYRRDAAP